MYERIGSTWFYGYKPTYNPHSCSNVIMVEISRVLNNRPKFEPLTSSKQTRSIFDLFKNEQVVEQVNDHNTLKTII
jgi:hypothetical protein